MKDSYPIVTCSGLIVNSAGEIFLTKSRHWSNLYVIPGGRVEYLEKMEDTLKRELKEETDLDVYDIHLLNVQEYLNEGTFKKGDKHFIFLNFVCKTNSTNVKLDKKEADEYIWIKPDKALQLPLETHTKKTVLDFIKNK